MSAWRWREAALLLTAFEVPFGHALVGAALLLVVALGELIEGEPLWAPSPLDPGLLAWLGVATASALVSPWRATALAATAATAAVALPVVRASVLAVRHRPAFVRVLLSAWAAGAILAAAWAILNLSPGTDARATLPHLTSNGLGTTLGVGLVVLTGLSLDARGAGRAVALLGLAVVALGLALTWSRGGWLGAGAGLAVLLALRPGRRLWWGLATAAATAALTIPVLAGQWTWHLDRLLQVLPATGPFSRLAVWRVALRVAAEHPVLGTGLATFGLVYERHAAWAAGPQYAPSAHNLVLHTAAELGALGVVALAILLSAGVLALVRWYGRTPGGAPTRTVALTVLAATTAFVAHQMVDVTIIGLAVSVGLFLLLGVGAGASGPEAAG
ncbi:MAG: O-antigen ligase family protein [Armatimonadota bacterium]|nr:O-antigen ligase family protein [Armatimonadota bacterium]MDR7453789.1 O-antigen ligase family protein [Armatimonadota bacterium]MDR7496170.1 O-antigen ligase family protein [Armatimonadota bacterium]MDR7511337.1 O-antigen ligase family protein [Armatimonadota bacterium]